MSAQAALFTLLAAALNAGGAAGAQGAAFPAEPPLILAQAGNCNAIGEAMAAENGGTLASASDAVQNGAEVCQIIIVVRGQNGERPRRIEIVVPKS